MRTSLTKKCASAVAFVALHGGSFVYMSPAIAQVPPLTFEVLAAGFSPDHRIKIRAKGPSDVLQARIVLQPGGDTGWHTHPGVAVAVVATGVLTEYHDNGCVTVHQAGSVFFESPDEVHKVINEGAVASEGYITFILPHGTQPLQPAADPGPRTCRPHKDSDHHRDHDPDHRD